MHGATVGAGVGAEVGAGVGGGSKNSGASVVVVLYTMSISVSL